MTVMRPNTRRPSGDWAIAFDMMSWVGKMGDVFAAIDDLALASLGIAADRHHQGRLAGAVGADHRDDLALVDVHVDAFERLDLAVEGVNPPNDQQRLGIRPVLRSDLPRCRRVRRRCRGDGAHAAPPVWVGRGDGGECGATTPASCSAASTSSSSTPR